MNHYQEREAKMTEPPFEYHLQRGIVEKDDVDQEVELLRLQGVTPNRRIIHARLAGQERALLYNQAPEDAIPLGYITSTPAPSDDTIESLVDWILAQVEPVQSRLWEFLEDPEERLESTLRFLQSRDLLAAKEARKTTRTSLAQILRDSLPATKEELVQAIRTISPTTERPEATVRQFLRRGIKEGTLYVDQDARIRVR